MGRPPGATNIPLLTELSLVPEGRHVGSRPTSQLKSSVGATQIYVNRT